jgi:hypothetical protein
VTFAGPGALSLDAALGLSWGEPWGVAALIAGFVAGLAVAMLARSSAQRHAPSAKATTGVRVDLVPAKRARTWAVTVNRRFRR